ncbi:MAG: hypothetical protein A4E38_01321 [Methanoregulaceae archaeon PtaB.Bin108]|jgi:hypothetical protein|nr:MAG: hypothetical protein A4E38_01321 [Methanoregulaceae archaeon PtaB.Bin108]OPY45550.1 MAG: hypothetical protein A4E42_00743 [Methanoregulaceae archaeon PtaU1.Bin222]
MLVRQISAHDRNYTYNVSGSWHWLTWTMNGLDFSLTGKIGPDELLIIAGAVSPVSEHDLEQLMYNGSG